MRFISIVAVVISFPSLVLAASPFEEAYDYCWAQQEAFIKEGVEMTDAPIHVSGPTWTVTWGTGGTEEVPGDTLSVDFDGVTAVVSGRTMAMADHVLTLANNQDEGRLPFMVRYEGTLFMIIPYPAEKGEVEGFCIALPLK